MAHLRALVADDEKPARDRIRSLLQAHPDVEIIAEAADGREALEEILELRPSLLFLDIQMPELDGFGVLQALSSRDRPPAVVFVTAYDTHAIRAFDVNAIDYLLKPYTEARFAEALSRARTRLQSPMGTQPDIDALLNAVAARKPPSDRLAVKMSDGVRFVAATEIDWLQADGNYTILHIGSSTLRTREVLAELARRLEPLGFMRVHRSIVVNVDRIFRLEPWAHGEYLLVLRNGTKLNSGRAYNDRVRSLIDAR